MADITEKVLADNIGGLLSLIQDNGATISGLKEMMDKVVENIDDLTKRIEQIEKKQKRWGIC